jgi:UDP-N-acetylglucosamine--dolichyl-phosphate N-acetylglucosaminephosphotransferase|tara:strand:+ start:2548 stop:3960 length:1413 start_codon:yes stop_codon:yes gene_type:complete
MSSVRQRSSPNAAERRKATTNDDDTFVIPREILEVIEKNRTRDVLKMTAFCLLPTACIIFAKGFVNEDMSGVSVNNMDQGAMKILLLAAFTSVLAYATTARLIPIVARRTLGKRNMFGLDINKKGTKMGEIAIPEALGLASGCAVLVSLVIGRTLHTAFILDNSGESEHNAALATIGFMLFLGFVDDVLDLPWRAKMILPGFAATMLAQSYQGSTSIVVPRMFRENMRSVLGALDSVPIVRDIVTMKVDMKSGLMDVGYIYIAFIWLLAVFLSNAINIHAGLNGLECGQSLVIAGGIIVLNVWSLLTDPTSNVVVGPHVFSLLLIAPFFAATVSLLEQNWYPSAVFVGDSYTYFAGMTLAVAGILGHFSETLLLFCLPQVVNFLYSIPQLFKIVPCPRHRLPRFETQTGLLSPSKATETRYNMNLVTLFLRVFGKTTERKLCLRLLAFQVACVVFTFAARYVFIAFVHWK